ncbi:MAG: hypothetical protein OXN83_02280 [Oligoflexia bacterium]|nr:hypothetical protein [Oligoflexia bacterium]
MADLLNQNNSKAEELDYFISIEYPFVDIEHLGLYWAKFPDSSSSDHRKGSQK